jgi:uroporphyrin-III C-methyltransferase/precorrin-2 dehydrogenase/sirohydrochlorin ferrochelatase
MPTRTLEAFAVRAIAQGLDPNTPAVAISRATRADQRTITAPIAHLHEQVTRTALPGPLLVMFGRVLAQRITRSASDCEERRRNQLAS